MSVIALTATLSFPLCLCVRLNEQDDKKEFVARIHVSTDLTSTGWLRISNN